MKFGISGDLSGAVVHKSKLLSVDLRNADSTRADFSGSYFTGANLYGTARDDWKIDGIRCEYIFSDLEGNMRLPKDRNFKPGEFE